MFGCLSFELGVLMVREEGEAGQMMRSASVHPLTSLRLGFRGGWPLPYDLDKAEVSC